MSIRYFRYILAVAVFSSLPLSMRAADVVWFDGLHDIKYTTCEKPSPVVEKALAMFSSDMVAVTGHRAVPASGGTIEVWQLDRLSNKEFSKLEKRRLPISSVIAKKDAFWLGTADGKIVVIGSNGRGAAYGILELSRIAGVSPWIWWGDVRPEHKDKLVMTDGYSTTQSPSVEYRGIFINDEDWSFRPWSHATVDRHKPEGSIGPAAYRKIYELLLRLRANTLWPAMHPGTKPFFTVKGNRELADSFGIVIGSSHCEPLMRNNVGEWDSRKMGSYNYAVNHHAIDNYWAQRVRETAGMDAIYTLGMRGVHDGQMEGVKTPEETMHMLGKVIGAQRKILHKNTGRNLHDIPQVFIPYKEVLEAYDNGLKVPDDVCLMWTDDNYGYIRRLPSESEYNRKGGAGVYYHLSYWGRPHDYLWLTTTQPGLICHEMLNAWNHNARRMWIVNVHDVKVAAYDLSLFLDMAWNVNSVRPSTLTAHLSAWLSQQFGREAGEQLLPVMMSYYKLTGERKPEFMGWSQVELDKKKYDRGLSPAGRTEFNADEFGNELARYIRDYDILAGKVDEIRSLVPARLLDAYFAAIEYPVKAAALMARKTLLAQESSEFARKESFHNDEEALSAASASILAYRGIRELTTKYDSISGGKWLRLMSMSPRNLPVFGPPSIPDSLSEDEISRYASADILPDCKLQTDGAVAFNASDYSSVEGEAEAFPLLGHSLNAVALDNGSSAVYDFSVSDYGSALVRIALIPTHSVSKGRSLSFSVQIDNDSIRTFSIDETSRTEQWKRNVLRGQVVVSFPVNIVQGRHSLRIKALDDNIVLDQWMLDFDKDRKFYLFPVR